MNDLVEGIVLKQFDYRENDLMISVLTNQFGKLSLVARGAKKVTSKNAVTCTPYVVAEYIIDYKEEKTMYTLKNGNLIESNRHLRENLDKMNIAAVLCELTELLIPQGVWDEDMIEDSYQLLKFCLKELNKEGSSLLPLVFFLAKTLEIQGICPEVDACVFCSSKEIQGIHLDGGGFICALCLQSHGGEKVSEVATLKRFRLINKAAAEHYPILEKYGPWTFEDAQRLLKFIEIHMGVQSEAWNFLKMMKK